MNRSAASVAPPRSARRDRRAAARRIRVGRLAVRPALPGDLVPLRFFFDAMLRRDYFLRTGQLEEMIRGPHHRVLVAEIDTVLVGVAVLTAGSRLVNALVHPAYRGLGIGSELIRRSGATQVRVKTDMSAGDPSAFYQSLGFVPTGRRNARGNIVQMELPNPAPRGK